MMATLMRSFAPITRAQAGVAAAAAPYPAAFRKLRRLTAGKSSFTGSIAIPFERKSRLRLCEAHRFAYKKPIAETDCTTLATHFSSCQGASGEHVRKCDARERWICGPPIRFSV